MRQKKRRQEKKKSESPLVTQPVPDHLNRINLGWAIHKDFCKDLQDKYC